MGVFSKMGGPVGGTGLVLSGGGARGAYQAGVLKALYQIARDLGQERPFPILTGVSAGAINATFMASRLDDALAGARDLSEMWSELRTDDVFRSDLASLSSIAMGWLYDLGTGHAHRGRAPKALLNTDPLTKLVEARIDFRKIKKHLSAGIFDGIAVSAINYATAEVNVFFQSRHEVESWRRSRRVSHACELTSCHVLASAAIPVFFPAVALEGSYYGDGALRNLAPMSSALHLGAERLIAVGVQTEFSGYGSRSHLWGKKPGLKATPSIARLFSILLNGVLMDATDIDLERLARINRTVSLLDAEGLKKSKLRNVPYLYLHPSEDLGKIAEEEERALPASIRFLLRGLGPVEEGADLLSYLMFEPAYGRRLARLGFQDTMARYQEIAAFISAPSS